MLEKHAVIEKNSILLLVLSLITISIGGLWEIVPLFRLNTVIEPVSGMRPYTPLELAGQNIYRREGCYNCHSQQIRPLRDEVERYGHYSLAAESMYDHPFMWGSKRTGPDLARVGGKYSNDWHVAHLINPRDVVPESIMPSYGFLAKRTAYLEDIGDHMKALKITGVPYTDAQIKVAYQDAIAQATQDGDSEGLTQRYGTKVTIGDYDGKPGVVTEMDALVAYLQRLGNLADIKDAKIDLSPAAADEGAAQ